MSRQPEGFAAILEFFMTIAAMTITIPVAHLPAPRRAWALLRGRRDRVARAARMTAGLFLNLDVVKRAVARVP